MTTRTCTEKVFNVGSPVENARVTADNKLLITVGDEVIIWDIESTEAIGQFKGHENAVFDCTLSSSGNELYTCSNDSTIRIWDMKNRHHLQTLKAPTGRFRIALSQNDE